MPPPRQRVREDHAVTEPASPLAWVTKRDGRLVPFEADKISRALFAATESIGQPDALLARELTDGIAYFLCADFGGATLTTAQIAETVIKVVRELGQPALARAFAEKAEWRLTAPPAPKTSFVETPGFSGTVGPSWAELAAWVEADPVPVDLAWQVSRACLRTYSLQTVFARD